MSRLQTFAARLAESSWLAAIAVVPSLFLVRAQLVRMYEPAKVSAVRCLAVTALGALLFLAFAVGWKTFLSRGAGLWKTPIVVATIGLVAGFVLATILSIAPAISFWGDYTRRQGAFSELSYVIFFFAIALLVRHRRQIDSLVSASLIGSVLPAFYGCWQAWRIDPLPWESSVRVFGTAGNPIVLAGFLIMVWPLTLARVIENLPSRVNGTLRDASRMRFVIYAGLLMVESLAIVYTRSRGPLVALGIGAMCFALLWLPPSRLRRLKRAPLAFGAIVVCLAILIPTVGVFSARRSDAASTIVVRMLIWRAVLNVLADHPLRLVAGYGPDTQALAIQPYYPSEIELLEQHTDVRIDRTHNAMLDSLMTRGVIGVVTELGVILSILVLGFRRMQTDDARLRVSDRDRLVMCALLSALCAHFVEIQFLAPVTSTRLLFWVCAGAATVVASGLITPADPTDARSFFAGDTLRLMLMVSLVLVVFTVDFYTGIASRRRIFSLLAAVWVCAALLVASHPSDSDEDKQGGTDRLWRTFLLCVGVSAVPWLTFSLLYGSQLESARRALDFADPTATGRQFADALTLAYGFCLVVILLAAAGSSDWSRGGQEPRRRSAFGVIGAAAAVFVMLLGIVPSVRESRAAITAGLGRSKELALDWLVAANFYERAAQSQSHDGEYLIDVGRMLMERGRREQEARVREDYLSRSVVAFEEARRRNPLDGRYVRLVAWMQRQWAQLVGPQYQKAHLDDAERLYAEAAVLIPNSASLWQEWGALAAGRGEYAAALFRLTKAISLNDRMASALSRRADVETRLGDYERAAADYQRARELNARDAAIESPF